MLKQEIYNFFKIDYIYELNRIFKLLMSVRDFLAFLVTPEDSSNPAYGKMILSIRFISYNISGGIKLLIWVFISVVAAILIGQLY